MTCATDSKFLAITFKLFIGIYYQSKPRQERIRKIRCASLSSEENLQTDEDVCPTSIIPSVGKMLALIALKESKQHSNFARTQNNVAINESKIIAIGSRHKCGQVGSSECRTSDRGIDQSEAGSSLRLDQWAARCRPSARRD